MVSSRFCSSVHAQLTDLLVPRWKLDVGVKGGLEAAIHCTRKALKHLQNQEEACMCILKLDFSNAFNECHQGHFLDVVERSLPEIFEWVQYCYCNEAELRFRDSRIISSTGDQQGDPLGPSYSHLSFPSCGTYWYWLLFCSSGAWMMGPL